MAKAVALHCDQPVLDPFLRLPEDLYENFLVHLSGKEILSLSKVSQRCDEIVSDNKRCLEKIKLVFSEATKNLDINVLQRDYRHLLVSNLNQMEKNCSLNNQKMVQLCDKVSKSVTSIEVTTVMKNDLKTGVFSGSFNELRDLKLVLLNEFLVKLFSSVPKLRSLVIGSTVLKHQALFDFINSFTSLDSLEMKFNIFEVLFSQDISRDVKFQLRRVKAQKTYNGRTTCDENFEQFLSSQAGSLKEIEFVNIAHAQTINLVLNSLEVEKLIINFVDEPMNLNPMSNKSVETLHIKNDGNYLPILEATQNLKTFHIQKLTTTLVEYLTTRMMSLEKVSYVEADGQLGAGIDEFYFNLLKSSAERHKLNVKIIFLRVK